MALNGAYPILLVGLDSSLSDQEYSKLSILESLSKRTPVQQSELDALIKKSESMAQSAVRVPFVFNADLIGAQPDSYSSAMVKTFELYSNGKIGTKSSANTYTINLKSKSSSDSVSLFTDVIYSLADILASQKDKVPRCAFFGGNLVIPNGYIVRISRQSSEDNELQSISIEIQKDLNYATPQEKAPDSTEVTVFEISDFWG